MAVVDQSRWSKDHQILLESGYFDPATQNDAPALPWKQWIAIGGGYVMLVGWSVLGPSKQESDSRLKDRIGNCSSREFMRSAACIAGP